MKVALIRYHDKGNINTRLPESLNKIQGILPPLGISYIASSLKRSGHNVSIIDAKALNLTNYDLRDYILRIKPEFVGITTMTSNLLGSLEACKIAKDCGAIVCIGGPQLDAYPEETLSYDFIDYGIIGEGEESTVELVDALENKNSVSNVEGLVYKNGGKIVVGNGRIVKDLDSLAFPARELLPMNKYYSIIGLHPVTTMITTRGCPYRCAFCMKQSSDKVFRMRSAKNVVDEMEEVIIDYHVKEIMFYDDVMTFRREHAEQICNEIIKRNMKVYWELPARVNNIDKYLLNLMRRAGCIRIRYGVESGDPEILKMMNKGITIGMVREVFKLTHDAGIETFAYFMIGYIGENEEIIRKTIRFSKELDPDLVMFTVTTPYPKTPLYTEAQKRGFVIGDYWRDFTLARAKERLPFFVKEADKWIRRAYREFYSRPKFVIKKLLQIRTMDQIKKYFFAFKGLILFRF